MREELYANEAKKILNISAKILQEKRQNILYPAHVFYGLLAKPSTLIELMVAISSTSIKEIERQVLHLIDQYPPQKGGEKVYWSTDTSALFVKAEDMAKKWEEKVDLFHLFIALMATHDPTTDFLKKKGITLEKTLAVAKILRSSSWKKGHMGMHGESALEKYTINLNKLAAENKIDPVIGRENEITQVIQILSRRIKNNPILLGQPGVGKTAIAEGLAQRIIEKSVPEAIAKKVILRLDLPLVLAGAKYKGEFEERLKKIVDEIEKSKGTIVLFIDEVHMLMGAGSGGEGTMDAANILKPALARGDLHAIGATTLSEYQAHIEKDRALVRRFQRVLVEEPSMDAATNILRGIKDKYEMHHGVRIHDEALEAAVSYAKRYIPERSLPDSAIDLIDQACAKRRIDISSMPAEVKTLQQEIGALTIEKEAARKEKKKKKEKELSEKIAEKEKKYQELKARWEEEKMLLSHLKSGKQSLEALRHQADEAERATQYGKVAEIRYGKIPALENRLRILNKQMEAHAFLKEEVDKEAVLDVLGALTGIPVSKLGSSDKKRFLALERILGEQIVDQEEAVKEVSSAFRKSITGIQKPDAPIGAFIFLGPTGVGKTALCKVLANEVFQGQDALVRIDLSEYKERHSISRLIGPPPGYVGYQAGGQLTEAIRRRPYSVLLFDEMEKAHPDFFNLLLPLLDEGYLTDSKGRRVNFKNTFIVFTSNLGSKILQSAFSGEISRDQLKIALNALLEKTFPLEFLGRIDRTILFDPLTKKAIKKIARLKFNQIRARLAEKKIDLTATPAYIDYLAEKGYNIKFGARPLDRVLEEALDLVAKKLLGEEKPKNITLAIDVDEEKKVVIRPF